MAFKLPAFGKKKRKDQPINRKLQIISKNAPFQYVEAYKTLRTNINFMAASNNYRRLVITSSNPAEGKSNVAINLAISLAENGKKVLIIDCDLRKPVMHKYLRITRRASGLTNVLSGEATPADVIVHFSDLNIDVITAGVIPPNPAELLGSARMVLESGQHPGALKDAVCSPGGSTIQGVRVLEERAFRGAVTDAVLAAFDKTKELGKQK